MTTARTGDSMVPYADLNLRRDIETGRAPGPDLDVTGPYLNGPGLGIAGVKALRGPEDGRRMAEYWADEGVTSFKVYMHISRAELAAVIETAHRRGLKVTGHLCSVTFREAADLGIDDLEHGLFASTDFAPNREPDRCPAAVRGGPTELDIASEPVQRLIRHLVERRVAITSTLPVLETLTPGRPRAPDKVLDAMLPETRDQYLRQFGTVALDTSSARRRLLTTAMALERAFARAGGLLVAGTDPTGYGGVVAGFANHREIELLVEAGFTPVEAIRIATLNGAIYLGRDREIGSIAPGKRADLLVVRGDPSSRIADIESVELVFKRGFGYDPDRLIAAARGLGRAQIGEQTMRHSLVPTVLLTLTACGDLPPGAQPRIEQTDGPEIVLQAGQEIQLRGTPLRIAFLRVIGDSRCPLDVVCVWAGNGAVELGLTLGKGAQQRFTLNTTVGAQEAVLADYRVRLVELRPEPVSSSPTPPEDYAVRLRVETGS